MNDTQILLTALITSGKLSVEDLIDMHAYFGYSSYEPTKGICTIIEECIRSFPNEIEYPSCQLPDGLLYHEGTKYRLTGE